LFFDVDHFKDVNDTYGHICGDFVLKEVCEYVGSRLRDGDLFGRMGGEEFGIFLLSPVPARRLPLRNPAPGIENHTFRFSDCRIRMTVSIGVAGETFLPSTHFTTRRTRTSTGPRKRAATA
jgi:diguanylate cyclase (GGDEF)-like protein